MAKFWVKTKIFTFFIMKLYPGEQISKGEYRNMSTIKIKGYASRKVNADRIRYRVIFTAKDTKTFKASEQIRKQCEAFLKNMKDAGFDISKFRLDGDLIEKKYNETDKTASRSISFDTAFDPRINNSIYNVIREENLNIEMHADFYLSYRNKLQKELMKEALLDSRNKAEMIASVNGQRISHAELVTDNRYDADYDDDYDEDKSHIDVLGIELNDDSFSGVLLGKLIEEHAELYVTWQVEEKDKL